MQEVTSSFPVHPLSHLIHKDSHPRGNIMKDLLVSRGYIQRLPGPHYTLHTHTQRPHHVSYFFFFTHFSFFGRNLGSKPIPILSTAFFFYFIYPSLIIIIIIFHSLLGFDIFKLLFKCIFYYVN